ncbi:MAG: chemotaxis protein CheW, partial [Halobacterium sp.]
VPPVMHLEDADRAVENAAHVVEFELGDEVCAIDIDAVDSIVESKQVTRVPRAPEAVEGVMDLRGETTAIVDPREFLAIDGDHDSDNILVLDRADDKQKIGLRVAEVTEVSGYADAQVDTGDRVDRLGTSAIERELVRGVIRKGGGEDDEEDADPTEVELVLWLDIDRLIDAVSSDENGDNQV